MTTPQQLHNFNLLYDNHKELFTPQQLYNIDLLRKQGKLDDQIPLIMEKIKASKPTTSITPEGPATTPEPTPTSVTEPNDQGRTTGSGGFFGTAADFEYDPDQVLSFMQQLTKANMRPILQGLGGMGGMAIGMGAGAPTGPGATVTTIAGGALGFALGDDLADILENFLGLREPTPISFELREAGKNIMIGAGYEIGGASVGPAIGMAGKVAAESKAGQRVLETVVKLKNKLPPLKAISAKKTAKNVLAADLGPEGRAIIAQNIEDAQMLEEMIPGLKFQLGQTTKDPRVISFEKQLTHEPGLFAQKQAEQQTSNIAAVKKFIESKKGILDENVARKILGAEQELIEQGTITAQRRLGEATEALRQPEAAGLEAGIEIKEALKTGKEQAKGAGGDIFDAIPEGGTPQLEKVFAKLEELAEPYSRGEASRVWRNYPEELRSLYEDLSAATGRKPRQDLPGLGKIPQAKELAEPMSYKDLNSYRQEFSNAIESLKSAPAERQNKKAIMRLTEMVKVIDGVIEEGTKANSPAAKAIMKARGIWRETVYTPFETGRVGKVLDDEVSDAKVALEFFKKGQEGIEAAKQFKSALGKNEVANAALKRAVQQDFLQKVTDPATKEIKSTALQKWLADHHAALKELDMLDDYKSITAARQQVDEAVALRDTFNKSIAADILQSDPGDAIKRVLNSKNPGQATIELMRQLKGDKQAIAGMQTEFINQLQRIEPSSKASVKQIESFLHKNRNVYGALYANDPAKLQAFKHYNDAVNRLFPDMSNIPGSIESFKSLLAYLSRPIRMNRSIQAAMANAIQQAVKFKHESNVRALLTKMSFDPEYAYGFVYNMKTKNVSGMKRFIERAFITLGEIETANSEE